VSSSPIVAAGCLVTRDTNAGQRILLVHRPRYNDWSLPKGKAEGDEHLTVTAVREVMEEAGVRVALRRPLPRRRYLFEGRDKVVYYWRAEVVDQAPFTPTDEVDEIAWLPLGDALDLVTQPDDASLVKLADEPPGTPFVIVRHGHAVKRAEWSGLEVDRPLDPAGQQQAKALVEQLRSYDIRHVHSSAARRCADTVRPYSLAAGVPLAAEPILTEEGWHTEPDAVFARTAEILDETLQRQEAALVCGHRPYLPELLDHLVQKYPSIGDAQPWEHPLPETVPTASLTVLHLHQGGTLAIEHHPS
jgi:8-oxo-dGTP diphosphatase